MVRASFLALFGAVALASAASLPLKHLAGPASAFASRRTPSTNKARIGDNSCLLDVKLDAIAQDPTATVDVELVADSETQFVFSLIVADEKAFALTLKSPNGTAVDLSTRALPSPFPTSISSTFSEYVNVTLYSFFDEDIVQGVYILTVAAAKGAKIPTAINVLTFNEAEIGAVSHLDTYLTQVGNEVGFHAWLGSGAKPAARTVAAANRRPLVHDDAWAPSISGVPTTAAKVVKAEVTFSLPNGATKTVVMHDDGFNGDLAAADGVFTGGLKATIPGLYTSVVQLEGRDAKGRLLRRTVQQMFPVVADTAALTKNVVVRHSSADAVTWVPSAAAAKDGTAALHLDVVHAELLGEHEDVIEVLLGIEKATASKYRVYTELWGNNGEEGVAWFGGMAVPVDVTTTAGAAGSALAVHIDGSWLASATGPFVLKHTTVYDVANGIVLSSVEGDIALPVSFAKAASLAAGHAVRATTAAYATAGLTSALVAHGEAPVRRLAASRTATGPLNSVQARFGVVPASLFEGRFAAAPKANVTTATVAPTLERLAAISFERPRTLGAVAAALQARDAKATTGLHGTGLTHGYCADANVFHSTPDVWTHHPFYFEDLMQSRSTDEFAARIHAFAAEQGFDSYNIVGHSQGGAASTQLANFYWTGLDRAMFRELADASARVVSAFPAGTPEGPAADAAAATGRAVQSIGTPYQGNTLAGTLAGIGSVIGIGCGTNFDMSRDGAELWNSGISEATRAQVYYATTTYKLNTLFGDSCSMAANSVLQWPNDGVSEIPYTVLEGGNDLGNTEKQCHTTDMNYVAQWTDVVRNTQFNAHCI